MPPLLYLRAGMPGQSDRHRERPGAHRRRTLYCLWQLRACLCQASQADRQLHRHGQDANRIVNSRRCLPGPQFPSRVLGYGLLGAGRPVASDRLRHGARSVVRRRHDGDPVQAIIGHDQRPSVHLDCLPCDCRATSNDITQNWSTIWLPSSRP